MTGVERRLTKSNILNTIITSKKEYSVFSSCSSCVRSAGNI